MILIKCKYNFIILPVVNTMHMLNTLSQEIIVNPTNYSKALMHICTLILYKHD